MLVTIASTPNANPSVALPYPIPFNSKVYLRGYSCAVASQNIRHGGIVVQIQELAKENISSECIMSSQYPHNRLELIIDPTWPNTQIVFEHPKLLLENSRLPINQFTYNLYYYDGTPITGDAYTTNTADTSEKAILILHLHVVINKVAAGN